MTKRAIWGTGLLLSLVLGYVFLRLSTFVYTDWLWFQQLGFGSVLITTAFTRSLTFLVFGSTFLLLAGGNLWVARIFGRHTRELPLEVIVGDSIPVLPVRYQRQRLLWVAVTLGTAIVFGLIGASSWTAVLRYLHPTDFGVADPLFGKDVGFYAFSLPMYNFVQTWLLFAVGITALLVAISYHQDHSLRKEEEGWFSTPYVRAHFSAMGAGFAALLAWGYYLKEYDLLFSFRKAAFFGPGYTDTNVQLLAYRVMLLLAIGLAILLLYNLHFKGWRLPGYGSAAYGIAVLLLSWLAPILFEQFAVKPNELSLESPYIQKNIEFTRRAYGLNLIKEVPFPAETNLTLQDIQNNLPTVRSIPLWDQRPLMATYSQLQEIRSYYRFQSVDVDRYTIGNEYRQVMLAGREFSRNPLSIQGDTWVNRHLVFTHGYGICMSPSNEVGGEGLPTFYVKDIPPVSPVGIRIDRPEIYFGENMRDYVVINTKTQEFDYPRGDENVYTTYQGKGGVPINTLWRRILFALRFADPLLFFTDNLTPQSRIIFDRHLGRRFREDGPKRFEKIAPFLRFDQDPYLVVAGGRLVWIQDAFTVTNMYPYSQPYGRPYVREANYIRNSVKATLDAYDGTVTFYVWDTEDPILQTYMKIFPDLFRPGSEMPDELRAHVRYPSDLFQIQSSLYNTYHMTSPQVFYNREDVWEPAVEIYGVSERPQVMNPYYVVVRPPGATREEYVLMLPSTPAGKANMIAWMFAHCDEPNYGRLVVYKLPKEKLIYGPMLVERRIDQDTDVSREITLWSQRGSDVIRGNLLVIPIENSFIYIEPLYLRATQSGMPELKRVLALHGEKLVMAENLDQALLKLFANERTLVGLSENISRAAETGPESLHQLIRSALQYFDTSQENLRKGDFAEYGATIQKLKQALLRMDQGVGDNEK